jgi:hypothetical protein
LIPQWIPAARNPCGAVTPRRRVAVVIFLPMIERIYIDLCRMLKKSGLLTRPTQVVISPICPESAKTDFFAQ